MMVLNILEPCFHSTAPVFLGLRVPVEYRTDAMDAAVTKRSGVSDHDFRLGTVKLLSRYSHSVMVYSLICTLKPKYTYCMQNAVRLLYSSATRVYMHFSTSLLMHIANTL